MKACVIGLIILLASVYSCCHPSGKRSVYYWKTTFTFSATENKYLSNLHINKLYLRLFDVDWDEGSQFAIPLGKIHFINKPDSSFEIIPVIYIVNKTLQKSTSGSIPDLASKILKQIRSIMSLNNLNFKELQIDCDWTESTRDKYFHLLSILGHELEPNKQILSATIRLHQIKYAGITGIPPVNRGMLMYYNMGKIETSATNNSIYNNNEASKYVDYVNKYPLPLDIALPSFSWGIHIRKNKVLELLNNLTFMDFEKNTNFIRTDSHQFVAKSSFFFRGFYFIKNDRIKIEDITPELCLQAAQQLASKLKTEPGTVAIFQIDSLMIKKYEEKKLEKIYNTFD